MASQTERKYVLTRVTSGDYILPSNDGNTIWRICKYTDGPSMGLDVPRDFNAWQIRKWSRPLTDSRAIDLEDWDRWEHWDEGYETRREAIDAALSADV